ncbi:MAG: DUF1801 domain-containing protein [Paludibaculum sp.]
MKKVSASAPKAKDAGGLAAVEAYLAAVPEPGRSTLEKIRSVIRSAAPAEATEAISYGMPAFKYKGGLLAYAAFKNHCSLFPMSLAVIAQFESELEPFRTSKGTLQFPLDKPLASTLVKKLVKAKVAENDAKK